MERVVAGMLKNKSPPNGHQRDPVKVHRGQVMRKMLAELAGRPGEVAASLASTAAEHPDGGRPTVTYTRCNRTSGSGRHNRGEWRFHSSPGR